MDPPASASSSRGGGLACRVLGHRYRFWHVGAEMRWRCERDCGAEGSKEYVNAEDAAIFAEAFDREGTGKRTPLSALSRRLGRRRGPGR